MQVTIDLPKHLAERLENYLKDHPTESLSKLVCEALEIQLVPKNTSKLLELTGIVTEAPYDARDFTEEG
jgi:metal-responsive CopG/Arc/MetJ family transcriptional regulator